MVIVARASCCSFLSWRLASIARPPKEKAPAPVEPGLLIAKTIEGSAGECGGRFAEPTNEIRERSHEFQGEDKDPSLGLGSSFVQLEILDLVSSRDKLVVEVARLGLDASARFVIYKQRTTRLTSVELEFGYLSLFPVLPTSELFERSRMKALTRPWIQGWPRHDG
jgi:hypothetical protein